MRYFDREKRDGLAELRCRGISVDSEVKVNLSRLMAIFRE
jgi:hypothetical protein